MSKKTRAIVIAVATLCICVSIVVGCTYALFTSNSKVDIAVSSGTVKLEAVIDESSLELSSKGIVQTPNFENGGSAAIEGNVLTLSNITPGDKVTFKINVKNFSTVNIKYKTSSSKESGSDELMNALDIKFNGGQASWTPLEPDSNPSNPTPEVVTVSVELPLETDNALQNLSVKIAFTVNAVQGNADVE